MKLILSLIVLCSCKFSICQDYQTFYSDRIIHFEDDDHNIESIRFDSVEFKTDSVFYPFASIDKTTNSCYSPYGASWIGHKLIIQKDGYNVFLNKDLDSIKIKTNAKVEESWTSYHSVDSLTITAKVVKHELIKFLGITDSVKTISFIAYDKHMEQSESIVNNYTVQLSKRNGLIKSLNFNFFPNITSDVYPRKGLKELNSIGLSNPKVGIKNLMWFDVHDFNVGDEIHTLFVNDAGFGVQGTSGMKRTIKTVNNYIDRQNYKDSIVYLIDRKLIYVNEWEDSTAITESHDTIKTIIHENSNFDKLPGESIIIYNTAFSYEMKNETRLSKIEPSDFDKIQKENEDILCWSEYCCIDGIAPSYEYIEGLGGPYYSALSSWDQSSQSISCVYYKKGDVVFGTPINTAVEQASQLSSIDITPNPASTYLKIETNNYPLPLTFKIFTVDGATVLIKSLYDSESVIEISDIPKSLYFYQILHESQIVKSSNLVIE